MTTAPRFDELLPHHSDPVKEAMRSTLITILESKGEILPSANSPRGKLWHLVNSPNCSPVECADIIQLDSALASRILRVANSGAYGGQSDNITDAVVRLGLKFVREQVFNAGVFKQFSGWVLPRSGTLSGCAIFSSRASASDSVPSTARPTGTEYLAGLLHDMGWLFLASYFPNEFAQIFSSGLGVPEAEARLLPFGHAQISAAIAARSLLPERAVTAIVLHHFPVLPTPARLPRRRKILFPRRRPPPQRQHRRRLPARHLRPLRLDFADLQDGPAAKWLNRLRPMPDLAEAAERNSPSPNKFSTPTSPIGISLRIMRPSRGPRCVLVREDISAFCPSLSNHKKFDS